MKTLEVLYIPKTKVTDLSPLKGMKLKYLNLNDIDISDLSPLVGMPLEDLSFDNTPAQKFWEWKDKKLIRKQE